MARRGINNYQSESEVPHWSCEDDGFRSEHARLREDSLSAGSVEDSCPGLLRLPLGDLAVLQELSQFPVRRPVLVLVLAFCSLVPEYLG